MEYYGNADKKALKMVAYGTMNSTTRFIKRKGMLMEYLLECNPCEESSVIYEKDVSDFKVKHFRNKTYLIERRMRKESRFTINNSKMVSTKPEEIEEIYIYKEVNKIYNTKDLIWRENKRYGVKETTYISGNFEFFIIAKPDGDAVIEARYTKCDNKHRNKVTISRIEVYNASSEEIMNAINEWKKSMRGELLVA